MRELKTKAVYRHFKGKYYYVEITDSGRFFPYTYVQYAWWKTPAGGSSDKVESTALSREAEAFEAYINKVAKRDSKGEIVTEQKTVTVDGEMVKLTPIEYNILLLLIKNQGKVFSIEQIYENIWNEEAIGADNTVAVHIRHIREKIEINPREPRYLKVVWGIGYKIEKM